jgi:hypothetical protein
MDHLRKQITTHTSAPVTKRPKVGAQTTDPGTTESADVSTEAAAAAANGLGDNSAAPTLRHEMHEQQ